jgi:hypothetical protein
MRRVFWVALGATAGILIVRKLASTVRAFSPPAMAGQVTQGISGVGESIREFAAEIKGAMAEREEELRAALAEDGMSLPSPSGKAE